MGKKDPVTSILDLCVRHKLVKRGTEHLKYSQEELLGLLNMYINTQEARIEKAKKIYLEQKARLEKICPEQQDWAWGKGVRPPENWNFAKFKQAKIDKDNAAIRANREKNLTATSSGVIAGT